MACRVASGTGGSRRVTQALAVKALGRLAGSVPSTLRRTSRAGLLWVLRAQPHEMFEKLQLHVLGVPPAKFRCQQRGAVACPIGKRDVSEEEFGLLIVSHRDEAGFSFRRLAD